MNIKTFFLDSAGRLRSGWRFLIFFFVFLFLSLPLTLTLDAFVKSLPPAYSQSPLISFSASILLTAMLAITLGWLCGYLMEDLPFRALGLSLAGNWLVSLALGFAVGAASICFAALLGMIFGGLSFQINQTAAPHQINETLFFSLLIFVIGAIAEEALFRGYLLQTLTRARLAWGGIVLTSFLFASAHNANPNATALSWLNTFLAGVWLAVAYLKTRNLWFPFAIHLAWNWFQGAILGINVSGLKELTAAPVLQAIDTGPTWLTGGHYGIEGGIVCTAALSVSTITIWFMPFLKPNEEMPQLTNEENPKIPESKSQTR